MRPGGRSVALRACLAVVMAWWRSDSDGPTGGVFRQPATARAVVR